MRKRQKSREKRMNKDSRSSYLAQAPLIERLTDLLQLITGEIRTSSSSNFLEHTLATLLCNLQTLDFNLKV